MSLLEESIAFLREQDKIFTENKKFGKVKVEVELNYFDGKLEYKTSILETTKEKIEKNRQNLLLEKKD